MTRIRIDGRELLVKKTTRALVDWQRQSGLKLSELTAEDSSAYGAAMAAFFALHNAGFSPIWDELLDRDIEEFSVVNEPGDSRHQEAPAPDPQSPPADSSGDGGDAVEAWPPAAE